MGGVCTAMELQDNVSSVLYNMCGAVNLAIGSMLCMQTAMEEAKNQIEYTTTALNESRRIKKQYSGSRIHSLCLTEAAWRGTDRRFRAQTIWSRG